MTDEGGDWYYYNNYYNYNYYYYYDNKYLDSSDSRDVWTSRVISLSTEYDRRRRRLVLQPTSRQKQTHKYLVLALPFFK